MTLREGRFKIRYTGRKSSTYKFGDVYVVRDYTTAHYLIVEGRHRDSTISKANADVVDEDIKLPAELFQIE